MSNRFVLRKAVLPLQLNKKEQPTIDFTITNVGYAALYNPRRVKIIFRNTNTQKEYSLSLKADPRRWFSGTHHIKENVQLPADMSAGSFQLFLYLICAFYIFLIILSCLFGWINVNNLLERIHYFDITLPFVIVFLNLRLFYPKSGYFLKILG